MKGLFWFFIGFSIVFLFFITLNFLKAQSVNVKATIPGCGDGIRVAPEQCDGNDLGGATCQSLGFTGGTLSCHANCTFNTSLCLTFTGGGGGGGGGGGFIPPSYGTVIFSGRAYPKSEITILSDGQIRATTRADDKADFSITITNLSPGNYIFSIYSEDYEGRRSSLLTFPVSLTAGATVRVGGIFIAPTIDVDKIEVKRGDNLKIFGQSVPRADITIVISSEEEFFVKTIADSEGVYLYNFDTSLVDYGTHYAKSKASVGNVAVSGFSPIVSFKVGTRTIYSKPTKCPQKADLNNDCRVNLVDFSIAAYWYKRPLSVQFKKIEVEKLNGDGKVDLIDFSIMAYWWTG